MRYSYDSRAVAKGVAVFGRRSGFGLAFFGRYWYNIPVHNAFDGKGRFGMRCLMVAVLSIMAIAGCSRPAGMIFAPLETPVVWPKPPEQPRIIFVGEISTEVDLKRAVSWTEGLGELIFGKKDIGVLVGPYAVVIDEEDRVFVADSASGMIQVFDLVQRRYDQFSSLSGNDRLLMPVALTLIDDLLYVVDSRLARVCVFDKSGTFQFSFGFGHFDRPAGIAYWPEAEKIFVTDAGQHVIKVFDKSGRFKRTFGGRGIEPGRFNFPTHICADRSGQLYVSDTLNYRVQILRSDGGFVGMFGSHGDRPGYFAHPCGIAVDRSGHIYVTDRQFENIQVFDSEGNILMAWGEEGRLPGQFWLPAGLFIDKRDRIYVADSFNKRIQVFEFLEVNENENGT
jgi:hypothetical protein